MNRVVRRLFVVTLIAGGALLACLKTAPPGAAWMQPTLDGIQQAFATAEMAPSWIHGMVGGGAGALLAWLLVGALLRPWRVLAMLLLLGGGLAVGWQLANGPTAERITREWSMAGTTNWSIVSLAGAALLLGVFELLMPTPAPGLGARPPRLVLKVWMVLIVFLMSAAGWLAWGEIKAPWWTDELQPHIDALQAWFADVDLTPGWARVIVGAGAAGILVFLLGGELWRPGGFAAVLLLAGLAAGGSWLLSRGAVGAWLDQRLGVSGWPPCCLVCLGCAGILLGVREFGVCQDARDRATSRDDARRQAIETSETVGLKIPSGKYTTQLAATSDAVYDAAIAKIEALAKQGDPSGLADIERLIRANAPRSCEFHLPDARLATGGQEPRDVIGRLIGHAKSRGGLFAHANDAQMDISRLAMAGGLADALRMLQNECGTLQRRCFQLLFEQLRIRATVAKARRSNSAAFPP